MQWAKTKQSYIPANRYQTRLGYFIPRMCVFLGLLCPTTISVHAAEPGPYGISSTTSSQRKQWDKEALKENYGEADAQNQAGHGNRAGDGNSANHSGGVNGLNNPMSNANGANSLAGSQQKLGTPSSTGIPGGFIDKATTDFKNITYFVVSQPLQAVMGEIVYLAGLQANLELLPEVTVTNAQFQGSLDVVMDQLAKRYGLIWNIESGIIDIAPLKSLITRALKVDGMSEERIVELLAAAGIGARRDVIALDESTGILRIRGTPRFVAKAEAAILLGKTQAASGGAPDESVHVVRYGRTSRVVNPQ